VLLRVLFWCSWSLPLLCCLHGAAPSPETSNDCWLRRRRRERSSWLLPLALRRTLSWRLGACMMGGHGVARAFLAFDPPIPLSLAPAWVSAASPCQAAASAPRRPAPLPPLQMWPLTSQTSSANGHSTTTQVCVAAPGDTAQPGRRAAAAALSCAAPAVTPALSCQGRQA
jgi:hypothetical protein